jgi:endonuclease/exonuclease/phosphatase family metal-dependent hydrolase
VAKGDYCVVKLLFLNVFEGCWEEERLVRIAGYVREEDPDILGLAELCGWKNEGRARLVHFAAHCGLPHGTLCESERGFDVGLLARCPFGHVVTSREGIANGLLQVELPLADGGEPLTVTLLHLSPFGEEERCRELEALRPYVLGRTRLVLMGDMNAQSPRDLSSLGQGESLFPTDAIERLFSFGLVDAMECAKERGPAYPTFPTPFPTYLGPGIPGKRIDYIFVSADLAKCVSAAWIDASGRTDHLSDHRPVLAGLNL